MDKWGSSQKCKLTLKNNVVYRLKRKIMII